MAEPTLLFVVGARPNFIKIAPICMELKRRGNIPFQIVHTGQHYDQKMSDVFFEELSIPAPDFHLNIGSGPHGKQTGKMMEALENLCFGNSFAGIVVIGDVNSTLAGALVGAKMNIPVVHIESGLRSFNRSMPEEINRIASDHLSDLLFAPTKLAVENLEKEGLKDRAIFSGDVMYDMALAGLAMAEKKSAILSNWGLEPKSYYLTTLHRPYNVDEPDTLKEIIKGLGQLGAQVILAAHPRLQKNLKAFDIEHNGNIRLSDPVGYLDFIQLQKNAKKIITDSGGVQKEAFFLKVPCVTLRPETEWVETVEANANMLVRDRTENGIIDAVNSDQIPDYDERPYGDGRASKIIIEQINTLLR